MRCFHLISGLRINLLKSNLFGVGVSDHKVSSVATFTRCSLGSFLFSYLGIPIGESMVRVKESLVFLILGAWRLSIWCFCINGDGDS
uniref:Uncharacterized protein n=1 Tax=Lactuca sativa TaxID=4236 RepID=A0A9R1XKD0_LACSA|nr:hypothetical protein LSAT_V11C400211660 [Lactuca sativa]